VKFPHRALFRWYQKNKRKLPWRRAPSGYKTWVSEVMLQQTQVKNVIPYFEKFIKRFPDVGTLARAREESLLRFWSGLGYYSRARNLQKAARIIVADFNGRIPDNPEDLKQLPGIGDYTMGAILSIAFNRSMPILDGNVRRVLSRFNLIIDDKKLWKQAADYVKIADRDRVPPSEFNQALMELGALICSPKKPECLICPLRQGCGAYNKNKVNFYPLAKKTKKTIHQTLALGLIDQAGTSKRARYLIRRRPPEQKWLRGMWEFPLLPVEGQLIKGSIGINKIADGFSRAIKKKVILSGCSGVFSHSITHHRLKIWVMKGTVRGPHREESQKFRWVTANECANVSSSSILRKALETAGVG